MKIEYFLFYFPGTVNRYGRLEPVNVQVIPGRILEDTEVENLAKDLDSVIKYGTHSNLINFIGICEDKNTIFAVFEQAWPSLKHGKSYHFEHFTYF